MRGSRKVIVCLVICEKFFQSFLGAFSHSACTAPIIMLLIPGTPLKPPTYRSMHNHFKTAWGAEFRTLGPVASIRLKRKNPWCTSRGCRVQNSGSWHILHEVAPPPPPHTSEVCVGGGVGGRCVVGCGGKVWGGKVWVVCGGMWGGGVCTTRRQRSTQRSVVDQSRQRHTIKRASTRQHRTHSIAEQSKVVYRNNSSGQPHHPPRAPTPAQHPTPRVGA